MKKWVKVLICVLVVLALGIGAVAAWQRNNIVAVYKAFTSDKSKITQEMDENKEKLQQELLEKYPSVIEDITAEQEEKILSGELTVEEVIEEITRKYEERRNEKGLGTSDGDETSEWAASVAETAGGSGVYGTNPAAVDKLIGDKVIEIYSLKAYYLGQLGQLESAVKNDYNSMPANKRNLVGKKELVSKYMGRATGLLNQCDAKIEAVLSELQKGLTGYKADTSIVKKIRSAYEGEKALKKAYYMSLIK